MKSTLKFLFYLCLIFSFTLTSCGSDGVDQEDEALKGIQIATTRSSGESDGIGLACNFSQIIKEYLKDEDLDELYEEAEKEGDVDKQELEELIDKIFNGFNKTMYMVVAGDNIDLENNGDVEVAGETFSISWFSDTDEPMPGTYEAIAAKINVENPDDLKNGAEISKGEIEVILSELTDESMIGTFSGQVTNSEGVVEDITGSFNVERASCEQ